MNVTINGRTYLPIAYTVRASEIGGWLAEVAILADDIAPGAACTVGGWRGTVRAVEQEGPTARLDVRAGDDALDELTERRQWAATLPAETVAGKLAAEAGTTASAPGSVATWHALGGTLREEVARLARWLAAGSWYVDELTGVVTIAARATGAVAPPGRFVEAGASWRAYALEATATELTVLVGRTVEGLRVERAVYSWSGKGPPGVDVFAPSVPASRPAGSITGGTVDADSEDRATITLDTGEVLGDVPLWFLPGVRVSVAAGTRVLVADLGGDPRSPVAFAAPFDSAPSSDLGVALRIGDVVMMPFGSAGTPTPTPLQFAPGVGGTPGPPGSGCSRVKL